MKICKRSFESEKIVSLQLTIPKILWVIWNNEYERSDGLDDGLSIALLKQILVHKSYSQMAFLPKRGIEVLVRFLVDQAFDSKKKGKSQTVWLLIWISNFDFFMKVLPHWTQISGPAFCQRRTKRIRCCTIRDEHATYKWLETNLVDHKLVLLFISFARELFTTDRTTKRLCNLSWIGHRSDCWTLWKLFENDFNYSNFTINKNFQMTEIDLIHEDTRTLENVLLSKWRLKMKTRASGQPLSLSLSLSKSIPTFDISSNRSFWMFILAD